MNIAIIDDQQEIRYSLCKILQRQNHTTFQFNGEENALAKEIKEQGIELLIVDVMLGDHLTGIDLIKQFKKEGITLPIILMTAYTTPTNMIEASKIGIKDILQKPFDESQLLTLVNSHTHISSKLNKEKKLISQDHEKFVGSYETMKEIYHKIGVAANNDLCVLIYGETGTGKELIANLIHTNSERSEHPFVALNCASIPKELFESQLFGHEKGSFTSADKQHIGFAEQTAEGTLFLDEIGELDLELQSKLLRFLETKTFRRVGGTKDIVFSGRVISATNVNLKKASEKGVFREDLYFRLSLLSITMPTLKERAKDIPVLCEHFIAKANKELKTNISAISKEALEKLQNHSWRGNIRELRNIIYSACLNARGDTIDANEIMILSTQNTHSPTEETLYALCQNHLNTHGIEKAKELETLFMKTYLHVSFLACPNISQLSNYLDVSRNTLKKQLREYGIYKAEEEA